MGPNYIAKLRSEARRCFSELYPGDLSDDLGSGLTALDHSFTAFQAGFISGCQFQLTYDKGVIGNCFVPDTVHDELVNAAFLPDGP